MDIATVLTDILVVLVAAKVAAEAAERLGVPAVVGEIVAGILVGPSVLGLVGDGDDVLRTLGEIGVILLLLEVGMEMDLAELGRVGRASLLVAAVGVACPMALGIGAMHLVGAGGDTALFVGAALTATSVGITARVFGDLRALASVEARTVLGAAVADDVMGLVVLTVVVRLVTQGSVSAWSVAGIVGVAVGFIVLAGAAGLRVSGPLFQGIDRLARTPGTLVALALAFTLAFARLADAARLAPIIGAFLAGIALSRSSQAPAIRRELAPVGHLFIPVFFLQIGIDADIAAFGHAVVLRDAALLLAAAAIGKLVSPLGAWGSPGDKLLIGLGMLPRGEVGLIFATLGLQTGVIGDDLYAALLLVVLVTTLATPGMLKVRYGRLRAAATAGEEAVEAVAEPPGGWLRVDGGLVGLAARPPRARALAVALEAAVRVGRNRPAPDLVDWLAAAGAADAGGSNGGDRWAGEDVERLFDVIERGNARSWRFLDTMGVLDRALPDLAAGLRARDSGTFALDPIDHHRFVALERFRIIDAGDPVAVEADRVAHPDRLLLGLLLADGLDALPDPAGAATRIAASLGFDDTARGDVVALVEDRELLWAAAHRAGGLGEEAVVPLATHLATPDRARTLYVASALRNAGAERWELARLRALHDLVQAVLADEDLAGTEARDLVSRHRTAAQRLAEGDVPALARIATAPRSYLLSQQPEAIVRHARLLRTVPRAGAVRVAVVHAGGDRWIDVAARDRQGLLAAVTGALADLDIEISQATVATWTDGTALETFCVRSPDHVPADRLQAAIEAALHDELRSPPLPEARVAFDHRASPWHTTCQIEAPDKPRLLHQLATAFAAARVDVVAATIAGRDGRAHDSFLLDRGTEAKLDATDEAAIVGFVLGGVATRRRRLRRPVYVPARAYELSGV
ncbi:MAG TPA: cation:proton antiporter [Acidimicrobiales bacterium]|nr:cation:proton antiporter [Acidimicrobiales bacterium]